MSGNYRGRRNWTLSMTVAVAVAAAAAVIGCMTGPGEPTADRVYLRNTAGPVLFDHGKHSETAGSCAVCHHDLLSADQSISCIECHDEGVDAADFEHTELGEIHNRDCSRCHEQQGGDDQAVSCRECHPGSQDSEDQAVVGCTECHDDSFTPEMMGHQEYLEIEDHSCLGCHSPGSVSEAYHLNCTQCHLQTTPKKFTDNDGNVVCGACHLR